MKRRALFGLALGLLAGGCATADSLREARGQGVKRTFRRPYEPVFEAALAAAKGRGLELIEQDRVGGRLLLSHGVTWGSLGERIAVFVTRLGERATAVEVVSRPITGALALPPDWAVLLLGDIEAELAAARKPR